MLRTILVPQDGSILAEQALPCAARLARSAGAKIILVRATAARPLPGMDPAVAARAAAARAAADLAVLAERLHATGLIVATRGYAEAADVAILNAAREYDADLIVM